MLVPQPVAQVLVAVEGIGTTTQAVQREEPGGREPLSSGVLPDEAGEFVQQVRLVAEGKFCLESFFESRPALLFQPGDQVFEAESVERRAPPERQRRTESCCPVLGIFRGYRRP